MVIILDSLHNNQTIINRRQIIITKPIIDLLNRPILVKIQTQVFKVANRLRRAAVVGTRLSPNDSCPTWAAAAARVVINAERIITIETVEIIMVLQVTVDNEEIIIITTIEIHHDPRIRTIEAGQLTYRTSIGRCHCRRIRISKGWELFTLFSFVETLFFFLFRELFGTNPTGINFDLYNDIPVESSHPDYPPIDSVSVVWVFDLNFDELNSSTTVISAKSFEIIFSYRTTARRHRYNVTPYRQS